PARNLIRITHSPIDFQDGIFRPMALSLASREDAKSRSGKKQVFFASLLSIQKTRKPRGQRG
ncbi:MAG: hypothetical protein SF339_07735, partial [Blastocatellia bacterium]|nr:hypothetical protein [Blastocatellia bacterium]